MLRIGTKQSEFVKHRPAVPSSLDFGYNHSYTSGMKTAISIPDPVFRSAEALARRLKISRSHLYANAVAEFVAKHRRNQLTRQLNDVYSGTEGGIDADLLSLQQRSLPDEEW